MNFFLHYLSLLGISNLIFFELYFTREWKFYNYEPKTVKFTSDSRVPEGKDADITMELPQFSSAAVLKVLGWLPC